jgi:hypothetical protein
MALIDKPDRARQWARAIASDLALYNDEKITQSLEHDNLFEAMEDEIQEGRQHYLQRLAPDLQGLNLYERALVDVMIKSKAHVRCKLW